MSKFESEPQPLTPIYRYYADIVYAEGQSVNLFLSFERLLGHLPVTTNLSAEALYDEAFMQRQLMVAPQAAKERMALMPFLHIAPLLEASDVPPEEIKQWYDEAVTGVSWVVGETHNTACLDCADVGEYFACEESQFCPQRFLRGYLSDNVYFADFQTAIYRHRPERAAAIASDKLEVGIQHKMIEQIEADAAWHTYCAALDDHICKMLGLAPLNSDEGTPCD